ncbi:MAG: phosphatidate cytidylyltransferase [Jatrophihabitantaceae bacterium]
MTDRDQPSAGEPAQPASTGRHGGGAGVSAAELIARSKAATPGARQQPSRSARRAAPDAQTVPPVVPQAPQAVPTAGGPAADSAAQPERRLRVVEALRSGGTSSPSHGLALAEPQRTGPALATPVLHPPDAPNGRPPADLSKAGATRADATRAGAPRADATRADAAQADTTQADATRAGAAQADTTQAGAASLRVPEIAKPPRKSRSGRNLPAAIGVGVSLALLVVGTLAVYRPSFVILLSIAVAIGVYEMVTAVGTVEARPPLVPLLAGVLAMEAAAWFRGPDGLVGALLLTVLGVTIWRLADGATGYLRDVTTGNLVALYIPFLAGFATLMAHADDGAARIVLFVLTVVCSDTGGYAVGVLFGKHPMAPTVSPKKSWEGFGGSLLAGGIAGVLMMVFCFHQQWWQGALFGVAIVATATLGDLGESMIKRDLGLKDMGKLLPGHGGVMDRLDSLLPCAPVAYLLLAAFLPG